MYDPAAPPIFKTKGHEYEQRASNSLNYFCEKLFLLKDTINTDCGRRIAEKRDMYMREFVVRFRAEWDGADMDI